MNFKKLLTANKARAIEWCKDVKLSLSFRGNEIGGEVGELQNLLKKVERHNLGLVGGLEPSYKTLIAISEELGDVVICANLIAMDLGIDLGEATRQKFNKTSRKNGLKTMITEGVDGMTPSVLSKIFMTIYNGGSVLIIMSGARQQSIGITEESTVFIRPPVVSGLLSARVDLVIAEDGFTPEVMDCANNALSLSTSKSAELIII